MSVLSFMKKKPIPHIIPDLANLTKEQKQYLRTCKPMIATCFRGGAVMGNYFLAMLAVAKWGPILGVKIDTQIMMGTTYVEQGRNVLANTFWNSDCTHLFFIDSDNGFISNNFFELLLCQKDIIGGVYTKRVINWGSVERAVKAGVPADKLAHCAGDFPIHMRKDSPVTIGHEPQKVLTLPTGFLCISRHTLQTYVKGFPDRKTTPGQPGHYGIQFFRAGTFTSKNENGEEVTGFDSEDNIFCKDMLTLGIDTYLAPWCMISHYGEHCFEACLPCSNEAYVHIPGWLEKQNATKSAK